MVLVMGQGVLWCAKQRKVSTFLPPVRGPIRVHLAWQARPHRIQTHWVMPSLWVPNLFNCSRPTQFLQDSLGLSKRVCKGSPVFPDAPLPILIRPFLGPGKEQNPVGSGTGAIGLLWEARGSGAEMGLGSWGEGHL